MKREVKKLKQLFRFEKIRDKVVYKAFKSSFIGSIIILFTDNSYIIIGFDNEISKTAYEFAPCIENLDDLFNFGLYNHEEINDLDYELTNKRLDEENKIIEASERLALEHLIKKHNELARELIGKS